MGIADLRRKAEGEGTRRREAGVMLVTLKSLSSSPNDEQEATADKHFRLMPYALPYALLLIG
jgi:hypothetical protein